MAIPPNVPISILDLAIAFLFGLITAIPAFVGALWYFGLDRKTGAYDKELRSDIEGEEAFRGIREAAYPSFVTTSNSAASRFTSQLQVALGKLSERPHKFVVVEGDTIEERKIEIIRERCREIPGKLVLNPEVVAAIRNHYSYKLALASDDIDSSVAEHFKRKFESYEFSKRVKELADSSTFSRISLLDGSDREIDRDALNDVFLPVVRATERWCIRPITDVDEKRKEIDRCRGLLMLTFFGLYAKSMKGIVVHDGLGRKDCVSAYNRDIRDENNWGYWLIPTENCDEEEFRRLRHMGWRVSRLIAGYLSDIDYTQLHPPAESLRMMEYVESPFWVFQKEEEVFRGGGGPN